MTSNSSAFEIDFSKTYEPLRKIYKVIHSDETRMWSFAFSSYFVLAVATLLIIRRTSIVVRSENNFRMSALHKFLAHLPILISTALLFYFSYTDIISISTQYSLFLLLFACDLILSNMISVLEYGIGRIQRFRGDPPNILEWSASLYFSRYNNAASAMYKEIIGLQLASIFLLNLNDAFGLHIRLIPSTTIGLLKIFHVLYYMIYPNGTYPFIFYLERIPEIITIAFAMLNLTLYTFGFIISGLSFL